MKKYSLIYSIIWGSIIIVPLTMLIVLHYNTKKQDIPDRAPWNPPVTQIEKNDWELENSINKPDSFCLKITFQEKYGNLVTLYCMALFRNDKTRQYKLVAPWYNSKIINIDNIDDVSIIEIPKQLADTTY